MPVALVVVQHMPGRAGQQDPVDVFRTASAAPIDKANAKPRASGKSWLANTSVVSSTAACMLP